MNSIGLYPRVQADTDGTSVVSLAGAVLLAEAARVSDLDRALSGDSHRGANRWRCMIRAKVITDLALTLTLGGDCLAGVPLLRAGLGVFGRVALDPTMSRTIDTVAGDAARARVGQTQRRRPIACSHAHSRQPGSELDPAPEADPS